MTLSRSHRLLCILFYGLAAILSVCFFAYLQSRGLVNALIDAQSHTLISSQIGYSLTPGMSQLSFWPPLIHILLLPVVLLLPQNISYILGGIVVLLPLLLASSYFIFGLLMMFRVDRRLSCIAALLIFVHPYMQYFTSSAMAEIPFQFCLLGTAYFAQKWNITGRVKYLCTFAFFVALTVLARYEGALLLPISTLFVAFVCFQKKYIWIQSRALLLLFLFVASLGVFFVMLYSYVYGNSIFSFMSLGSDLIKTQVDQRSMSMWSVFKKSFTLFAYASFYMHGYWMVVGFVVAFVFVLFRFKWEEIMILFMLISPAIFVLIMMTLRRNTIDVPHLPKFLSEGSEPYGFFQNTRYALTWFGALIVSVTLALDNFSSRKSTLARIVQYVLTGLMVGYSIYWLVFVTFVTDFSTIRMDSSIKEQSKHESVFIDRYDHGYILILRDHNVAEMFYSDIRTDKFVTESNYLYFDQAMKEPWLFVRWVIVKQKNAEGGDARIYSRLSSMLQLEKSADFQRYFELVQSSEATNIYRLNEEEVRNVSNQLGYNPNNLPSINPNAPWDPLMFYRNLLQ